MKGVKDERIRQEKADVVYAMACKTCEALYIGETARWVCIRGKEHHAHARNRHPKLSAVAEHTWTGHEVDWVPSDISTSRNNRERKFKKHG